jgi:exosome complex component RRP4
MQSLVVPGQAITEGDDFLRGHGSYIKYRYEEDTGARHTVLVSCVAGQVERINKLVSVRPYKGPYGGEVGDLVVGRISAVESKRWKVSMNGSRDAVLQLSAVNLEDGEQRMRTHQDALQMRSVFEENDLLSAEIQNIGADGQISLHTRSMKYGKLENGLLIEVPAALIKKLAHHYVTLEWGIDVLIGRNGFIWITRTIPEVWKTEIQVAKGGGNIDDLAPMADVLQALKVRHRETPFTNEERLNCARVYNICSLLSKHGIVISPESISLLFQKSLELGIEAKHIISRKEDVLLALAQADIAQEDMMNEV